MVKKPSKKVKEIKTIRDNMHQMFKVYDVSLSSALIVLDWVKRDLMDNTLDEIYEELGLYQDDEDEEDES